MRNSVLLLVVLVAGCASAPKNTVSRIAAADAQWMASAPSISIDVEPAASFMRFGREEQALGMMGMMFGAIGGAAGATLAIASAHKEGALLVKNHALVDPTLRVAELMKSALGRYQLTDDRQSYVMVRLATKGWGMSMGRAGYFVELKALNPAGQRVMVKSECRIEGGSAGSDDGMLANAAAALKAEHDNAARQCAENFLQQVFATPVAG